MSHWAAYTSSWWNGPRTGCSTIEPLKYIQATLDLWCRIGQSRRRSRCVRCTWLEGNLRHNLWGDAVSQVNINKSTSGWLSYMSGIITLYYIDVVSNTPAPQIRPLIFQPHPGSKHLRPSPLNPITEKKVTMELDRAVFTHTNSLDLLFFSGKHVIMLLFAKCGTLISDRDVRSLSADMEPAKLVYMPVCLSTFLSSNKRNHL